MLEFKSRHLTWVGPNSTSDFDGVIQSLLDCVLSSTVYVAHAFLSKASKFKSSSVFGKMQDASG